MESKNQQVRDFIERQVKESISVYVSQLSDRPSAEIINQHRTSIANRACWHITETYRFLELADIMGWRRTSARR